MTRTIDANSEPISAAVGGSSSQLFSLVASFVVSALAVGLSAGVATACDDADQFLSDFDCCHVPAVESVVGNSTPFLVVPFVDVRPMTQDWYPDAKKDLHRSRVLATVGKKFKGSGSFGIQYIPDFVQMFGESRREPGKPATVMVAEAIRSELEAHGFAATVSRTIPRPLGSAFSSNRLGDLAREAGARFALHGVLREFRYDFSPTSRTTFWTLDVVVVDAEGTVVWEGDIHREPKKQSASEYSYRDTRNAREWFASDPGIQRLRDQLNDPESSLCNQAGFDFELGRLAGDVIRRNTPLLNAVTGGGGAPGQPVSTGEATTSASVPPTSRGSGAVPSVVWESMKDRDVHLELLSGLELSGKLVGFDDVSAVVLKDDGAIVTVKLGDVARLKGRSR